MHSRPISLSLKSKELQSTLHQNIPFKGIFDHQFLLFVIHRLVNMKHLGDVCLHNDFNEIKEKIFPLFDSFLSEEEKEIRIEFANQLPSIAQVKKHSNVTSTLLGM